MRVKAASSELESGETSMHDPRVPETVEGWWLLHQMFQVMDTRERSSRVQDRERSGRAKDTAAILAEMAAGRDGFTVITTLLGHKADLMLIHARPSLASLQQAEHEVSRLPLFPFLEPRASYVSVVELSLYDMTGLLHARLREQGLTPGSSEHDAAFAAEIDEQRQRVKARIFPEVPRRRYVSFYPMGRRRGETRNWYALPFEERAQHMHEHGKVGRRYAGRVNQVISGSIGYDDWEWGVDLFADDPLVFKRLIYEMRFEETSVWYAEFGPFWTGLQFSPKELPRYLEGEVPDLITSS
jgi:peroxiredoxin